MENQKTKGKRYEREIKGHERTKDEFLAVRNKQEP